MKRNIVLFTLFVVIFALSACAGGLTDEQYQSTIDASNITLTAYADGGNGVRLSGRGNGDEATATPTLDYDELAATLTAIAEEDEEEATEETATDEPTGTPAPTNTLAPTATAAPTQEPTVAAQATDAPTPMAPTREPSEEAKAIAEAIKAIGGEQVFADGNIKLYGFPEESRPVRWGNGVVQDNDCPVDEAGWILCDPGVISFDYPNGSDENNPSAVWSGGAQVDNLMENETGEYTCPEGGYMKVTYPQANTLFEQTGIGLITQAAVETNITLVVRCLYADDDSNAQSVDRNVVTKFATAHPGRVKVMRYPVDPAFSGFYSFVHLDEDLANGHGELRPNADNCGNSGCLFSWIILLDLNHKTVSVFFHTMDGGWVLIYTNAVMPS